MEKIEQLLAVFRERLEKQIHYRRQNRKELKECEKQIKELRATIKQIEDRKWSVRD